MPTLGQNSFFSMFHLNSAQVDRTKQNLASHCEAFVFLQWSRKSPASWSVGVTQDQVQTSVIQQLCVCITLTYSISCSSFRLPCLFSSSIGQVHIINNPTAIRTTGTGETSTFRVVLTVSGCEHSPVMQPANLRKNAERWRNVELMRIQFGKIVRGRIM